MSFPDIVKSHQHLAETIVNVFGNLLLQDDDDVNVDRSRYIGGRVCSGDEQPNHTVDNELLGDVAESALDDRF